jgi:hypothetical protein
MSSYLHNNIGCYKITKKLNYNNEVCLVTCGKNTNCKYKLCFKHQKEYDKELVKKMCQCGNFKMFCFNLCTNCSKHNFLNNKIKKEDWFRNY